MRLVLEDSDFRRLSPEAQKELIGFLAGRSFVEADDDHQNTKHRWRRPMDITRDQAGQLLHGLAPQHRSRLTLMARQVGRASMRDLLEATEDTDWHVLSHFQGVVTRKLRRLVGDREKKVHLIGWDYDSTIWDESHKNIVDGIYYVSPETARSLLAHLEV